MVEESAIGHSESSVYTLNHSTFNPTEYTICVNMQSSSVTPSVISGSFWKGLDIVTHPFTYI